jgi:hypothetical protein
MLEPCSSSTQAGRLSLPACVEEITQNARRAERRSLSARQAAEPQFGASQADGNLDKLAPHPASVSQRADLRHELQLRDASPLLT